jgi:EmrB/QacA subfamily drug resistance transporter
MIKIKDHNTTILIILFLGVFMGALDISVVGPVLTPIKDYFDISSRQISWVFTIYILMNLIGTPILAKLSDMRGRRLVYILAITLFGIGSLIVSFAPSFWLVVFGRGIQGFGAGGIFPVAAAVIGDSFPTEKRGRYLGLIGAVFGIAAIIGPIIGGILLMIGWQAIFLINIPIAIFIIILAAKNLPATISVDPMPFDWLGTFILSIMLGSFIYALNQLDTLNVLNSITSINVYPFLIITFILLLLLINIERKSKNPIITPILFKTKQLNLTHFLAFGAGFCEISLVYLPMLSIVSYAVSPSSSSFMLIPCVLALSIGAPTFGRMLDKFGSRTVLKFGTFATALGMFWLSFFTNSISMFFITTVIIGFGLSALLGAPIRYILLEETDKANRSSAQGLMAIFTSIGQLISAAFIGAVISSAGNSIAGFSKAYLIIGVFSILLLIVSFLLKKR